MNPKADAGQDQEVIEGSRVTLDGTKSDTGVDSAGISYSWKQVGAPKVRIIDANAAIASFDAPKISSTGDKLTLKFVLSITDSVGRSNDKDTVKVVVKHDPSVDSKVSSPTSNNNNIDNKDKTSSHEKRNGHTNNIDQVVDNNDSSQQNGKGNFEEIKNEESSPQPDSNPPIDSAYSDTNNSDTNSN